MVPTLQSLLAENATLLRQCRGAEADAANSRALTELAHTMAAEAQRSAREAWETAEKYRQQCRHSLRIAQRAIDVARRK